MVNLSDGFDFNSVFAIHNKHVMLLFSSINISIKCSDLCKQIKCFLPTPSSIVWLLCLALHAFLVLKKPHLWDCWRKKRPNLFIFFHFEEIPTFRTLQLKIGLSIIKTDSCSLQLYTSPFKLLL